MAYATPGSSDNEDITRSSPFGSSVSQSKPNQDTLQAASRALSRTKELLHPDIASQFRPASSSSAGLSCCTYLPSNASNEQDKIYRVEAQLSASMQDIHKVITQPQLWDEWGPDSRTAANLDDNSSLLYSVLNNLRGTSHSIDLCTVETTVIEQDLLFHAAASVDSDLVPLVQGRHRGRIGLQSWVIHAPGPGQPSKVSYFLQVHGKTLRHPSKLSVTRRSMAKHALQCVSQLTSAISSPSAAAATATDDTSPTTSPASSVRGGGPSPVPERKRFPSLSSSAFRRRKHGRDVTPSPLKVGAAGASTGTPSSDPGSSRTDLSGSALAANGTSTPEAADDQRPHLIEDATTDGDHDGLAKMMQASAQWDVRSLATGGSVWIGPSTSQQSGLPAIRTEVSVKGVSSEAVLAAVTSPLSRASWQHHFRHSSFDGTLHHESFAGLFPHISNYQCYLKRAVQRSRADTLNPFISILSQSESDSNGSESPSAQMFEGWHIQPKGANEVLVRYLLQLGFPDARDSIPDFVGRVLASEQASDLKRLKEVLEGGHTAVSWVRWADGPRYVASQDASKDSTEAIFKTDVKQSGSDSPAKQRAWLCLFDNEAFRDGAALDSDPQDAVESVAAVDDFPGVWEVTFSSSCKEPVVLSIRPTNVEGNAVSWKGQRVTDKVAAPRRALAAGIAQEPEAAQDKAGEPGAIEEKPEAEAAAAAGLAGSSQDRTFSDNKGLRHDSSSNTLHTSTESLVKQLAYNPPQLYMTLLIAFASFVSGMYITTFYSTS